MSAAELGTRAAPTAGGVGVPRRRRRGIDDGMDITDIRDQLAVAAREAARLAGGVPADRLAGRTPCPDYDVRALAEHLTQEIVLHCWDLAVATGQAPRFPDEVAATVLRRLDDEPRDGWYEAPVRAAGAAPLDRAVARSGRDPAWRPGRPDGAG